MKPLLHRVDEHVDEGVDEEHRQQHKRGQQVQPGFFRVAVHQTTPFPVTGMRSSVPLLEEEHLFRPQGEPHGAAAPVHPAPPAG